MEKSTEKIIKDRLKSMVGKAQELKKEGLISENAAKDRYVRIKGDSFRAVSLRKDYPLCGCVNSGAKKLEAITCHFNEFDNKLKNKKSSESIKKNEIKLWPEDKQKKKPERSLQCWMIREALNNDSDLLVPLGIDKFFDKLRFALDEVSLGDKNHPVSSVTNLDLKNQNKKKPTSVRCDLLAVGKINGKVFPIIIELKSNRAKTDLIGQVDNFAKLICHFKDEFIPLLEACTELKITDHIPRKIIIWPQPKKENNLTEKHLNELNVAGISVLEYAVQDKGYKFKPYWAK